MSEEAAPQLTPEDRIHGDPDRNRGARERWTWARLWIVLKRAAVGVYNDGFIHAGNLAYLTLMTLFPFFIVAAAVLSALGQGAETQRTVSAFLHVLPPSADELLRGPIAAVLRARTGPLLWFGALVGLWTVGSFVETIRDIFRRAYGTRSKTPLWRARLGLSFAIIVSVVLALLSFLIQGLLLAAQQFVYRLLPFAEGAANWIGLSRMIPGVFMFGALYMLFYSVTPVKYRYTKCLKWPGALFTATWWVSMTALLPVVLGQLGGYDLTYGSLAGVVVMLLFFYLIGLGLVFGAHLNAALAEPVATGVQQAATDRNVEAAAA